MKSTILIVFTFLLLATGAAQAQTAGIVTLRANSTTGQGSVVPVLTWSTNPVATSCRASGGWSGTKTAAGTVTLASINASTNYTLTCSWGAGSARVSWTAPTTNTNGSTLTDLAGFRVYYGTSSTALSQSSTVNDMAARATTIDALPPGTWYFAMRAFNSQQAESPDSNVASKAVTGASAASTVAITVTAAPPPTPVYKVIKTPVYEVVTTNNVRSLGRTVGSTPIGTVCDTSFYVPGGHARIPRNLVTFTRTPRSESVVARCDK